MNINYYGTASETGLNLTVNIYFETNLIYLAIPMNEVGASVYTTGNIFNSNPPLPLGIYVARVVDEKGRFISHGNVAWDGTKEVDINTINSKLWSRQNRMEIRDALGLTGDKSVAKNGQLQKKSESPYNNTIDTNEL